MNYITTSRKPGNNCRQFTKEIGKLLNTNYITRGKASLSDLISTSRYNGAERLFVVTESSGNPKQILEVSIGPKIWEFSNTYFVTLHSLTKKESSAKMTEIEYLPKSKAFLHLLKGAGVESADDAKYVVKEDDKGVVSVYFDNKETGLKFKVFYKEQGH